MSSPAVTRFLAAKESKRALREIAARREFRANWEVTDRCDKSVYTSIPAPGWKCEIVVEYDDFRESMADQAEGAGIEVIRHHGGIDLDDTDADGNPQVKADRGVYLRFDVPSDRDLLRTGKYGRSWPACAVYHLPRGQRRPAAVALARELLETWAGRWDSNDPVYYVSLTLTAPDGSEVLTDSLGGIEGDYPALEYWREHAPDVDAAIRAWNEPEAVKARAHAAYLAAVDRYAAAAVEVEKARAAWLDAP